MSFPDRSLRKMSSLAAICIAIISVARAQQPPAAAPTQPDTSSAAASIGGLFESQIPAIHDAAASGSAVAQFVLARAYFAGLGVTKDPAQAYYWMHKSAVGGFNAAQIQLGIYYSLGRGTEKDVPKAKQVWDQAAAAFDNWTSPSVHQEKPASPPTGPSLPNPRNLAVLSAYDLCFAIGDGTTIPKDSERAFGWCMRAANAGLGSAQERAAMMLAQGQGVPQDPRKAAVWLTKAAHSGSPSAESALGALYASGNGVDKSPQESFSWYLKAATGGFIPAQVIVSRLYLSGEGVHSDVELAYFWRAVAQRFSDSPVIPADEAAYSARIKPERRKQIDESAGQWTIGGVPDLRKLRS